MQLHIFIPGSSLAEGKFAIKTGFMNPIVVIEQHNETNGNEDEVELEGSEVTTVYSIRNRTEDDSNAHYIE